jgi:hypothetical protein
VLNEAEEKLVANDGYPLPHAVQHGEAKSTKYRV